MNDSLLYYLNVILISDTAIIENAVSDSNAIDQTVSVNFLKISNISINPEPIVSSTNFDVITYSVILLLGIVGITWYILPDRFLTIFSIKPLSKIQREGNSSANNPGLFFVGLFWIIFILSLSFFSILVLYEFYATEVVNISHFQIFSIITASIIALFLYRFILSYWTAFVFQTQKLLKLQIIINRNIQLIIGILLLPVSLIIIYTNVSLISYFAIATILAFQAYRIIQIVLIGNSSTVFSAFHIILYLCALEILPVLVLLRLINNGFEI